MPRRPNDSDNWGGARPNAGRPSISDEATVSRHAVIPESLAQVYDELAADLGVSRSAALRAGLEAGARSARKVLERQKKEQK